MKQNIKYIAVFFMLLFSKTSFGQMCQCFVDLVKVNDCCADLIISFNPLCAQIGFSYNQITINSGAISSFAGQIDNITLYNPNVSYTLNATEDLAILTSSTNLITPANSNGGQEVIGRVCYKNVPNGGLTNQLSLSGTGPACENFAEFTLSCLPSAPWNKLYGDMNDNKPRKIKAFGNGVYVLGETTIQGVPYATVSKFNLTNGMLIWEKQLDISSELNDLEYSDGFNPEIIAVGNTVGTIANPDNQTLIVKMDAGFGNITQQKLYNLPGREFFEVIVKHKNPVDVNFPYYILGRKNPVTQAPSTFDIPFLVNLNDALTINWFADYELGTTEIESYRGIVDLNDGNLVILGNGTIANEGVLTEVNGQTGAWVKSNYYPDGLDLYDGIELPGGDLVLAGTKFSVGQAVIFVVKNSGGQFSFNNGLIFPNVNEFREIGMDANGDVYTVGQQNGGAPNFHIIHQSKLNGNLLSQGYTRYLFDNEIAFTNPHIAVTSTYDAIYFADGRTNNSAGFGNLDILVGSFDLDLSSNCRIDLPNTATPYMVSHQPIMLTDNIYAEPVFTASMDTTGIVYQCTDFCTPPMPTCDFTWVANCFTVTFTEIITNGTPPYVIDWDFDGDLIFDFTGSNPNFTYAGAGTWNVTMRVTDASGTVICEITKPVVVQNDIIPPVLTCPSDIAISTDPGLCTSNFALSPVVIDDCDPSPMITCGLSGATIAQANTPQSYSFNKGITTVLCTATDFAGNIDTCSFIVTVEDNEDPIIICPMSTGASVAGCEGGSIINFNPPTVTDNCPMATFVTSHQSGDFFPCGTTVVTGTATDMSGNTSTCSFNVNINCQCMEIVSSELTCTNIDNEYAFSLSLNDLTGSINNTCVINMTTNQPGVTILTQTFTTGIPMTVTGTISIPVPPIPISVTLLINLSCTCPNGNLYDCVMPVTLSVPCCKEISVDNQEVCKNVAQVSVPLVGCNNLFAVQQVRWYISDAPCPAQGSYGAPFQVTNSCSPLILEPQYHNADICVYAEIDMGSAAGPCTTLTSNTAIITLCEPVGCSIGNQEYCYFGSPITPTLLTTSLNPNTPNCPYTAEWYDDSNVLVGTGLTYQPPALSLTAGSQDCSESFSYRCEITSVCGISSCVGTITLHNDDAPLGNLYLNPSETLPLCPGEDAALQYDEACTGSPAEWDWFRSNDNFSTDITPLPSNGTMNPTYLTNRLYQDTWIRVEKQNGNCPIDEIDFFIDVTDVLAITNFTASYTPLCNPTDVAMTIDWTPNYSLASGCDFTIDWYQNGVLLQSTVQNTSPASFSYSGSPLFGNYYAIIRDNCCGQAAKSNVITIDPPMEVVVVGPCFRCKCETITLEAVIENEYSGCTYQWYENGNILNGETGKMLTITPFPVTTSPPFINYTFEIICPNGCSDTQMYNLRQCGDCTGTAVEEVNKIAAILYPNPTTQKITIEFEQPIDANTYIEITSLSGQRVAYAPILKGTQQFTEDLSELTSGLYFITVMKDGFPIFSEKLVKE